MSTRRFCARQCRLASQEDSTNSDLDAAVGGDGRDSGGGAIVAYSQFRDNELPAGIPPRPAAIVVDPQIRPVSPDAPTPSSAGVRTAIAASIKAPELGEFTGQISDPRTGEVLWSKSPDKPRVPASNAKVLTGAAALIGPCTTNA